MKHFLLNANYELAELKTAPTGLNRVRVIIEDCDHWLYFHRTKDWRVIKAKFKVSLMDNKFYESIVEVCGMEISAISTNVVTCYRCKYKPQDDSDHWGTVSEEDWFPLGYEEMLCNKCGVRYACIKGDTGKYASYKLSFYLSEKLRYAHYHLWRLEEKLLSFRNSSLVTKELLEDCENKISIMQEEIIYLERRYSDAWHQETGYTFCHRPFYNVVNKKYKF